MAEFDNLFAAIAGQESGGNYNAVNGRTGASGKYQIMPANVGPWSQKYLGRTVSLGEFRSSPQVQDQLARAVLQDYYNRYGVRGAASAWYSGNPSAHSRYVRFRSNEPSIGEYVDQVIRRMGQNPQRVSAEAAAAGAIQSAQNIDNRARPSAYQSSSDIGDVAGPLGLTNVAGTGLGMETEEGLGSSVGTMLVAPEREIGTIQAPGGAPRSSSTVDVKAPQAGSVSGDINARVTRDGKIIDAAMNSALNAAQARAGVQIRVAQGSWSNAVKLSAGTHNGTQVADLVVAHGRWNEAVNALRAQGYAAWFRNWPGNLHIHVVGPGATGKAAQQYQDYLRGGDGLA